MKPKTLLSMFVNKAYEHYIPLFIFFAQKSYPEYDVLIHFTDSLCDVVRNKLSLLDQSKFTVKENQFKEYNPDDIKFIRWFFMPDEYDSYDYIFIGDIDILLMQEDVSLTQFHFSNMLMNCELPFDNTCGLDPFETSGNRATGLHFVEWKEYKSKTILWILKHFFFKQGNLVFMYNDVTKRLDNQHALYEMLFACFGCVPSHTRWRYHGLHLGHSRVLGRWDELLKTKQSDADYPAFAKQFYEISESDPIAEKMYDNLPQFISDEITTMMKAFEKAGLGYGK